MKLEFINKKIIPDIPNDKIKITIINTLVLKFLRKPKTMSFVSDNCPILFEKEWTTLEHKPVSNRLSHILNMWDRMGY